ncbi:hypothetical protein C7S20_10065 [Christiangramia fulva]|uniref:Uncharacterized protein n=1 Tax=Christiangramia fulva TaxID=2126553 RepID=A0A2R3Z5U1_9FLAO|nr:hypothetical protein [Christiangramia fulva]AVR45582.1 hypothetical protein C7S20_10065 [Christiangramia fulva]
METSFILAKLWGWYLFIFFVVLSIKPQRIQQIFTDFKDSKFSLITAFLAFIIGLLSIHFYNEWNSSWTTIISLLGWTCLAMGLLLFIIPQKLADFLLNMNVKLFQFLYVLLFLLGIFLLNMGYELVLY